MLNMTVVILTFNEIKHIERCIKSLTGLVSRIVVVDSFSTDGTVELCESLGAEVFQNIWRNYANQFQWGLDNCGIDSVWTMRMDADEYLENELVAELEARFPLLDPELNGVYLKRKVFFKGRWIKYGGFYPHVLLRIWKTGEGRIEQRWMDEHIVIEAPKTTTFNTNLVDDNLNHIGWWTDKHNSYASREMVDLLNMKYRFLEKDDAIRESDDRQAKVKRFIKEEVYSRLPLGVRPVLYFFYRYVLRGGFLDGGKGFLFHLLQGLWYRLLVDIKVSEVERLLQPGDKNVKTIIRDLYGIEV